MTQQIFIPASSSIADAISRGEMNKVYTQLRSFAAAIDSLGSGGSGGSGYVPTSTTINGHPLTSNITITKADIGLASVLNVPSYSKDEIDSKLLTKADTTALTNYVQLTATVNEKTLSSPITLTASDVGLSNVLNVASYSKDETDDLLSDKVGYIDLVNYVPITRTVNGKALDGNISIVAADISDVYSKTDINTLLENKVDITSGMGQTYLNNVADLHSISGTTDATVFFSFNSSTLNIPVSGAYGRGFAIAGGGNYTTLVAFVNGTFDTYICYNQGGTWTAWAKIGYNDNDSINTPWIAMKLQNGWTVTPGQRAVYRKVGGKVQISWDVTAGTTTDGTLITVLPVGYRPNFTFQMAVLAGVRDTPVAGARGPRIAINTDGSIIVRNATGAIGGFFEIPLQ